MISKAKFFLIKITVFQGLQSLGFKKKRNIQLFVIFLVIHLYYFKYFIDEFRMNKKVLNLIVTMY